MCAFSIPYRNIPYRGGSFVARLFSAVAFVAKIARIVCVVSFFLGLFFLFLLGKELLPEPTSLTNCCWCIELKVQILNNTDFVARSEGVDGLLSF